MNARQKIAQLEGQKEEAQEKINSQQQELLSAYKKIADLDAANQIANNVKSDLMREIAALRSKVS